MFFDSDLRIVEIAVLTILTYVIVVIALRISGKRTIADYTAFDWIVSITVGSIAASTIIIEDVSLSEGIISIIVLFVLQTIMAFFSVKSRQFRKHVEGGPTLLYYKGHYLEDTMIKTRVTKSDILQSIRLKANKSPDQVQAVILEKNGRISVIDKITKEGEITLFQELGIEMPKGLNINE